MILPAIDFILSNGDSISSYDLFGGKRVVIFSLPGAFTPTCTNSQLPAFEAAYSSFKLLGIDEVYCISVNDDFVMQAWGSWLGIENVELIPDGDGDFTEEMNMLVEKPGMACRSWRYAMIVSNGRIDKMFVEPGMMDDALDDPYGETAPERILDWLNLHS